MPNDIEMNASETSPEITAEPAVSETEGTDSVVESTKFLIEFIAKNPKSILGGDGFYLKLDQDDPRSELVRVISEITKSGFVINDFDSAKVSEILV